MNDQNKAELRRLAEDMPDLDWDSQFEDHEQTGFCCVYAKPFELDGEMHDGPTFVERCHPEQAKFIAEAKENVLSLLDENDQLRAEVEALRKDAGRLEFVCKRDGDFYFKQAAAGSGWMVMHCADGMALVGSEFADFREAVDFAMAKEGSANG